MSDTKPLLLTGAAGALGRWLRPRLIERYGRLISSDIVDGGPALANEEFVVCDLADGVAVERLVDKASAILHFGGVSVEAPFMRIMHANIQGCYNVFEAARLQGKKRIVYASSNHVIGFHETTTRLDATATMRPDTYYGVSKAFGENLASLYADKHGMDIASLRIGTSIAEPTDPRHLSTWLAREDLLALIDACLKAGKLGHTVLYGASANTRGWWDNSLAPHVDYRPQDNAERFAASLLPDGDKRDHQAVAVRYQGGPFCSDGYDR